LIEPYHPHDSTIWGRSYSKCQDFAIDGIV